MLREEGLTWKLDVRDTGGKLGAGITILEDMFRDVGHRGRSAALTPKLRRKPAAEDRPRGMFDRPGGEHLPRVVYYFQSIRVTGSPQLRLETAADLDTYALDRCIGRSNIAGNHTAYLRTPSQLLPSSNVVWKTNNADSRSRRLSPGGVHGSHILHPGDYSDGVEDRQIPSADVIRMDTRCPDGAVGCPFEAMFGGDQEIHAVSFTRFRRCRAVRTLAKM